jgi:adenosylcobinamide-GDP ribazoletransferase
MSVISKFIAQFCAGVAFYTCLPVPRSWTLEFHGIARVAPLIGILIGGLLAILDQGLQFIEVPILTRSALIVATWIALTGGLHLDGAMDTADGLAVNDPQRRLAVMTDSHSGAFGVMAAVLLLLLKTTALADLPHDRAISLITVAGWARWGQLVAIVRYPYLKPTGKGAFHKASIHSGWNVVPTLIVLLGISGWQAVFHPAQWYTAVLTVLGGSTIALATGAWFAKKLGGHTGDTYGAVVEWTEALLLVLLTVG